MAKAKAKPKKKDTTANLGFEAKLWATADALRNKVAQIEREKYAVISGQRPRKFFHLADPYSFIQPT